MTPDEREEFEENRADLIENAGNCYGIHMEVGTDDKLHLRAGTLGNFYEFYQEYRSEIEEMI